MSPRRLLKNRFLKDSAILQAAGGVTAGSQLVSSIVVANAIGAHEQGVFFTALAVYSLMFMLVNTGVLAATVTQLAVGLARGQVDRVASWLAFLVKVYGLAGLGLLLVVGWGLPTLGEWIADDNRVGVFAWWLALSPLLELPRVVAQATFQGTRRMADLARLELGTELARLVFVSVGAIVTADAVGPIVGTLASAAFGSVLGVQLYRAAARSEELELPSVGVILAHVRDVPIRKGLRLGLRIGALRSADALGYQILPPLFIQLAGRAAGNANADAWVTYFRIGQNIMKVPVIALQGISRTALPALSKFAGLKDHEGFRKNFLRVTFVSGAATAVGVGLGALLVPYVLPLLQYPDSYHEPITRLAQIMALGYCVIGFTVAFDSFFIIANRMRFALTCTIIAACFNYPAMYLLIRWMPETGAAWSMVLNFAWSFVLLGYMLLYFGRGAHHTAFDAPPPSDDARGAEA